MTTATATPAAGAAPITRAPFATAARERFAGTFKDQSILIGASAVAYDLIDIAAGDFTAGVYLQVSGDTAGNSASTAFQIDAPFSALQQVELLDPAGGTFHTYSGYELYIINMLGGYTGQSDQAQSPYYLATTGAGGTGGSFHFMLRIPAEIFPRDGIGALWNGSTAAQFKVRVTLAPSAAVYTTAPTVLPSVRLRVNSHGYQLPGSLPSGRAFMDRPPGGALYQNWNRQPATLSVGNNLIPLTRKSGGLYRQIIFIWRDVSGVRSSALVNGDVRFRIDGVDHFLGTWDLARQITWERNRQANGLTQLPAGITQQSWCHDWDGLTGGETRDWWVPVAPGSIVELAVPVSAAGSVTILVNDVSPTDEAIAEGVVTL